MNKLLKRKYYSLDEAAERLRITNGDLLYHLKEGNIHYFLPGRLFRSMTPVPYEDLPNKTVDQINHLAKRPDLFKRTFVEVPDHILKKYRYAHHEFYWMPHRNPPEYLLPSDTQASCHVFMLNLTNGMPVGFFNEYSVLEAVPVGKLDNNGIPIEAVITVDEIELHMGEFMAVEASAHPSGNEGHSVQYVAPSGTDDAGRKIVEYANRYVADHGVHPTATDLWNQFEQDAKACKFEYDDRTNRWYLQNCYINERGLKSRLQKYRVPSNTPS